MSRSLLLDIARESITEVFEAKSTLNREKILNEYPVLNEPIGVFVSIFLDQKLRGFMGSILPKKSLLEEIISYAKKAAFEDERFEPLRTSEYLQATIEISLLTPLKKISYKNIEDIKNQVVSHEDGMLISLDEKQAGFLPQVWLEVSNFEEFFSRLLQESNINNLDKSPEIFTFQLEKQRDEPILQ